MQLLPLPVPWSYGLVIIVRLEFLEAQTFSLSTVHFISSQLRLPGSTVFTFLLPVKFLALSFFSVLSTLKASGSFECLTSICLNWDYCIAKENSIILEAGALYT